MRSAPALGCSAGRAPRCARQKHVLRGICCACAGRIWAYTSTSGWRQRRPHRDQTCACSRCACYACRPSRPSAPPGAALDCVRVRAASRFATTHRLMGVRCDRQDSTTSTYARAAVGQRSLSRAFSEWWMQRRSATLEVAAAVRAMCGDPCGSTTRPRWLPSPSRNLDHRHRILHHRQTCKFSEAELR